MDVEQAVSLVANLKGQHGDANLMQCVNSALEKIKRGAGFNDS